MSEALLHDRVHPFTSVTSIFLWWFFCIFSSRDTTIVINLQTKSLYNKCMSYKYPTSSPDLMLDRCYVAM